MAETSLVPLDLPNFEKSKHIPIIASIHMVLSNISTDSLHAISSIGKAVDTGVVSSVDDAYANMTTNWEEYSYSNWLIPLPVMVSGEASIQVEGMDAGISFSLISMDLLCLFPGLWMFSERYIYKVGWWSILAISRVPFSSTVYI